MAILTESLARIHYEIRPEMSLMVFDFAACSVPIGCRAEERKCRVVYMGMCKCVNIFVCVFNMLMSDESEVFYAI